MNYEVQQNLIDLILNKPDLGVLGDYLLSILNKPLAISDYSGKFHMTRKPENSDILTHGYAHIPNHFNTYAYNRSQKVLTYFGDINKRCELCIIIYNTEESDLPSCLMACETTILPLHICSLKLDSQKSLQDQLKKKFIEDLLLNNMKEMDEVILKCRNWGFDYLKTTLVTVYEPEKEDNLSLLHTFGESYLNDTNKNVICSNWVDSIVLIWPLDSNLKEDWDKALKEIRKFKVAMDHQFKIISSVGVGQSYPSLREVHSSYKEAKTSIIVSRLMGERNFIKPFTALGVFKLLYMSDISILKAFCQDMLGPILNFDSGHNAKLMKTLRVLFDKNMDLKTVAEELFVHVNTLKYRIGQVEELMNIDFHKFETRVNLFLALKLRDSLLASGFVDK